MLQAGPPVVRAIKGWTRASAIHNICAADIGHMDATTAPISVWGESQGRSWRLDPEGWLARQGIRANP